MLRLNNCAKFSPPSRLKIGYDIDGVLADFLTPFNDYLFKKTGEKVAKERITDYSWWKCFTGLSEGDFWKHFDEFGLEGYYRKFPALRGAKSAVPILLNRHDYHFITSRPDYTYDDTIVWLQRNFGPVRDDKITFCRGGDKSKEILKHGVDVFIEDAPHHILDIAKNTDITLYIMDAPYNRSVLDKYDNGRMFRFHSWDDLLEELY